MCTVSYINTGGQVIITSNRDETQLRSKALLPMPYTINGKEVFFPKDSHAGGTWFAYRKTGQMVVLLNGAKVKHQVKPFYRRSRGLIVLDIISSDNCINTWEELDLADIQPFTLVVFNRGKLYELIWDGLQKSTNKLNALGNYIWSSVTLYPEIIRQYKKEAFHKFIDKYKKPGAADVIDFHASHKIDDLDVAYIEEYQRDIITQSISQLSVNPSGKAAVIHLDLVENKKYSCEFTI